jgi:hypothetical protein
MVKEKGPAPASEYTNYRRQLANTQLVLSDKNLNVPAYERKSIVSRSPIVDALNNSFISRFSRKSLREFISSFGNVSILHGKSVVYNGYAGITGAAAPIVFNDAILFLSAVSSRNVIVHVPLNGSAATLAYDEPSSAGIFLGMTVYNNEIYVSLNTNPNVIRRATLNPVTKQITLSNFATITGSTGASSTRAIAFDRAGNMYAQNISSSGVNRISKILPNGTVEENWSTAITNAQPTQATCVVVNGVEYLYVASAPAPAAVRRIRLDNPSSFEVVAGGVSGGFPGNNVNPVGSSIGTARAVTSDSYGNIYISTDDHNRQYMIDVETGLMRTIVGNGEGTDNAVGDIPGTSADTSQCRGFTIDERTKTVYALSTNGVIRAMPYFVSTKEIGGYI